MLILSLNIVLALTLDAFALRGTVVDPTGAPIVGARVAVRLETATPGPTTQTDAHGAFVLTVPPGRHTVTVSSPGFVELSRPVSAGAAGSGSFEFVLQVDGVREIVNVSAPAAAATVLSTATRTPTPLRDVPQSVTVVDRALMDDLMMTSMADVVGYVPGVTAHQGENNRDEVVIRGNRSSADFFVNGVRDDVQYYRDLYNLERVEALKGPNAMIFGRGGGGGVINRVTKDARFEPLRELSVQGGMFGHTRLSADLDQPFGGTVALRVNGMLDRSDSFRRGVSLDRYGVTPTMTIAPDALTRITLRYEHLHDTRVADRGITSFQGRPADVDRSTYYGDPDASHVRSRVNIGAATVERRFGGAVLRNHTLVGDYDRFYQNFVPGAATADMRQVSLSSYNNASNRLNLFNQTDLTYAASTGRVGHTLLAGAEVGRQRTVNFRNTGYFNDASTSILVPFASPTTAAPVTFRQSATDADNRLRATVAAVYAQDQIALSRRVQLVGGLRVDRFDLRYRNNRTGAELERPDNLVSPRAGIVLKPIAPLSVYGSYSVSYLPGSGDQFSSLTSITQQIKPERFDNYEVGGTWDLRPGLSLTTAIYRLDRTNTRATDPNDATRIVQTGSQRTRGVEAGLNGRVTAAWRVAGGVAFQDAFVTSATTAARAGAQVAQVPHRTVSVWNDVRLHPRVSAGLGIIHRSDMFAAIDNTVTLAGYTRADAAAYVSLTTRLRLQVNVENLLDARYFANADNNTNISPGFPRAIRLGLTAAF